MRMKDWINQLIDLTIVFSFDHSEFIRHCPNEVQKIDLSGRHGIVTGASNGIGLAVYNIDYNTAMSQIHIIDGKEDLLVGISVFAVCLRKLSAVNHLNFAAHPFSKRNT